MTRTNGKTRTRALAVGLGFLLVALLMTSGAVGETFSVLAQDSPTHATGASSLQTGSQADVVGN